MSETNSKPASDNKAASKVAETYVKVGGKHLYQLYYRQGTRPPTFIVFPFEGDLPSAINRGRQFCANMDLRFCGCYHFLVELDELEKKREKELSQI